MCGWMFESWLGKPSLSYKMFCEIYEVLYKIFHLVTSGIMMTERKQVMVRESVDLWPFIMERVQRADEDVSWWPGDEMRHWSDEGDEESEPADLSEIEESDDEAEAEQDWEFLKDWGKKFENLNKIFNQEEDDDDDETET